MRRFLSLHSTLIRQESDAHRQQRVRTACPVEIKYHQLHCGHQVSGSHKYPKLGGTKFQQGHTCPSITQEHCTSDEPCAHMPLPVSHNIHVHNERAMWSKYAPSTLTLTPTWRLDIPARLYRAVAVARMDPRPHRRKHVTARAAMSPATSNFPWHTSTLAAMTVAPLARSVGAASLSQNHTTYPTQHHAPHTARTSCRRAEARSVREKPVWGCDSPRHPAVIDTTRS